MSMTTTRAITPPATETTALTRWEALQSQIAIAQDKAKDAEFDYEGKSGNKEARSYVARLRKLRADIERCRKDAKAIHVERGRAVDQQAKELEASVLDLIAPHEHALEAIERREQQRVAAHRSAIYAIEALSHGVTTSSEAEARLVQLSEVDTSGLQEFREEAERVLAAHRDILLRMRGELATREAEQAELEALRAELEARQRRDEEERIAQEAIEAERQRAEREQQQAAAAVAQREADARAAVEAAQAALKEAERRAEEAEARERERQEEEDRRRNAQARTASEIAVAKLRCEDLLRSQLVAAMEGKTREQVAGEIVAGTLHPALACDWDRV